jgi:hypothetical protein
LAGGVYLEPRFKLLNLLPRRRTTSKDSDFRRRRNDGSLAGPVRVSTVVLHRPIPVDREMPGFVGLFVRRVDVAEREGFSVPLRDPRKTALKSTFSGQPRQVVCTGILYRNRCLSSSGFGRMVNAFHHLG